MRQAPDALLARTPVARADLCHALLGLLSPESCPEKSDASFGEDRGERRAFLPTALLFDGEVDIVSGRPTSPFSRNLAVPHARLSDGDAPLSLRGRDLRYATLDASRLAGADLTSADLSGASLRGADLKDAMISCAAGTPTDGRERRLRRCARLVGADLAEADLRRADLSGACGATARFDAADGRGASFNQADLRGAGFEFSRLDGSDFAEADLRAAALSDATARGARFRFARLSGVAPTEALDALDIVDREMRCLDDKPTPIAASLDPTRHADFSRAMLNLADLRLVDARNVVFAGADLSGADLTLAQTQGADFTEADATGADFRFAALHGAELSSATLDGAALADARLDGATLRAATLHGVDLSRARLAAADLRFASLSGGALERADLTAVDLRCAALPESLSDSGAILGAALDAEGAEVESLSKPEGEAIAARVQSLAEQRRALNALPLEERWRGLAEDAPQRPAAPPSEEDAADEEAKEEEAAEPADEAEIAAARLECVADIESASAEEREALSQSLVDDAICADRSNTRFVARGVVRRMLYGAPSAYPPFQGDPAGILERMTVHALRTEDANGRAARGDGGPRCVEHLDPDVLAALTAAAKASLRAEPRATDEN